MRGEIGMAPRGEGRSREEEIYLIFGMSGREFIHMGNRH